MALLEPPCTNEMSEVDTNVSGRLLSNATKLIWVQKTLVYYVELESIANDFLNELAISVE